jgi:hypothetical protein
MSLKIIAWVIAILALIWIVWGVWKLKLHSDKLMRKEEKLRKWRGSERKGKG